MRRESCGIGQIGGWLGRLFLVISILLLFLGGLVAAQGYNQAPMLQNSVDAGTLPSVENRLPSNPLVVQPLDQVGVYGGTIYRAYNGVADQQNLWKFNCRQATLALPTQSGGLAPNLLTSWEFLDGSKTLRFHLRKGVKWSDGQPLTVEDIMYRLERAPQLDFALIYSPVAASVKSMEKIDDYTLDLHFENPFPLATQYLRFMWAEPKHYLQRFDPEYDPETDLGDLEAAWSPRISSGLLDKPVLTAWKVVEYIPKQKIVAERNPYYFAVDTAGNQLPYVDRVVFSYVADLSNIPAKVVAGEITMQARNLDFSDYSFYVQNEKQGGYNTVVLSQTSLSMAIRFNYSTENLKLRELFWNIDFRKALSLGIDREAINNAIFYGQAEPWSFTVQANSAMFPGDEYAKLYTQFDPVSANALLDKLGLKDTNGDGYREFPGGGEDISFDVQTSTVGGGPTDVVDMVATEWREYLGLKVSMHIIPRELLLANRTDNKWDATAWKADGGINPILQAHRWNTLQMNAWGTVGIELTRWYETSGKEGVEPPPFIQEINRLWLEAADTIDATERNAKFKELFKLYPEDLYAIGTTTYLALGIVSTKLGNVPDTWTHGHTLLGVLSIHPEQFYFKDVTG